MKYFITERRRRQIGGTCYFEFQRGKRQRDESALYWRKDSLLLHADIADKIALYRLIPDFQYYGDTVIDRETWETVRKNALHAGAAAAKVIAALCGWAEDNFRESDHFTIRGI